ncbi:MAG: hypothetical protein ACE5JX_10270 [Acidobacteriota bacterium]
MLKQLLQAARVAHVLICVLLTAALPHAQTIETLYVVQMSHADVGFNAPPTVMQQRNHDRTVAALDLADLYPDFSWTVETGYQLEGFLDRASAVDLARLQARLSEDRFAFGANFTNLHSGLCGEEEIHRVFYPAAELGVQPLAALLNDVPGFTMAIPRAMAGANVPYAVLGANDFIGSKPDIPLAERPFWWEASDGSRVLTWLTYGSYIEGYFDWGLVSISQALDKITTRLDDFEQAGYPYDSVLVLRGADDEFPDSTMPELAEEWNATYSSPQIKLATADEFFNHLLAQYGDVFPTYRGDASGMWESVTEVTPATTARVRRARSALPDVEALWAVLNTYLGLPYPAGAITEAWRLSLIFDEHSGGGFGWPGLLTEEQINQENQQFVAFARRCKRLTEAQSERAVSLAGPRRVPTGETGLVIFNPLGAAFAGIVEVDCNDPQPADLRLVDPAGGPDPIFRWTKDDRSALAFPVQIPAQGWRRWQITGGGSAPAPPSWSAAGSISAGDLELVVDPESGFAVGLLDGDLDLDWLAQPGPHRFGGLEVGTNLDVFYGISGPVDPGTVTVLAEEPSPVFRSILVRDSKGQVVREYRLYQDEKRVDLRVVQRRSELPFVPFENHSDHYAVTFPANLSTPTILWVDGPDGWYRPGPDSLPGAGMGHFAASTGARLEGAQGRWMSISSPDSAMLDLGEMDESALPTVETDENTLSWKLIRHADLAEVKGGAHVPIEAEPGMPDETHYWFVLRFGQAGATPPDRQVMRRDIAPPLSIWVENGSGPPVTPASTSFLSIEGPAQLVAMKRSEAGDGLILRLRAGSSGGTATLTPIVAPSSAWLTDLVEQPTSPLAIDAGAIDVPLVADGVVTVLLR